MSHSVYQYVHCTLCSQVWLCSVCIVNIAFCVVYTEYVYYTGQYIRIQGVHGGGSISVYAAQYACGSQGYIA